MILNLPAEVDIESAVNIDENVVVSPNNLRIGSPSSQMNNTRVANLTAQEWNAVKE